LYIAGGWLLPGRKRIVPYSIQTLKRLKPALFRQDLIALLALLQQQKIKPLIAQRFPLVEARHAQELLGKGGVIGKIVLARDGSSLRADRIQIMKSKPMPIFVPPLEPGLQEGTTVHISSRQWGVHFKEDSRP
jgi:hypothetical protein